MKFALNLLFLLSLGAYVPRDSLAGPVISDGGGHPLLVIAQPYPRPDQLDRAFKRVIQAIYQSNAPESLRAAVIVEYDTLRSQDKFKLLPEILIVTSGPEGHIKPSDPTHFISLGGMTANQAGAHVFFSQRVTDYDDDKLADLILHEILHHVLPIRAAEDEAFVHTLAGTILNGRIDHRQQVAIRTGIVMRDGYISGHGLARWLALNFKRQIEQRYVPEHWDSQVEVLDQALQKSLGENISGLTASELINRKIVPALYSSRITAALGDAGRLQVWGLSHDAVFALALTIDPTNPLANRLSYDSGYCKKKINWVLGQRCTQEDQLMVDELVR